MGLNTFCFEPGIPRVSGLRKGIHSLQKIMTLYHRFIQEDTTLKNRKSPASEISAVYLRISRAVIQLTFRHQKIGDFVEDPRAVSSDSMASREESVLSH